jgi:hypothetical protein
MMLLPLSEINNFSTPSTLSGERKLMHSIFFRGPTSHTTCTQDSLLFAIGQEMVVGLLDSSSAVAKE